VIGSILGAFGMAAAAVRLLTPLVAAHLREWTILVGGWPPRPSCSASIR